MRIVAIDPDCAKSGVAVYDTDTRTLEARVSELVNAQVFESCETGFWHSVPEDAIWAYVADLPRPELMTIKNQ